MRRNLSKSRLGEKHITNEGYEVEIISYTNKNNVDILFNDGTILKNKTYRNVKIGSIKNPFHNSIYGICYLGVGIYKSKVGNKNTVEYRYWKSMCDRCYSEKHQEKQPTYKDVSVCEEWHNFQVFAQWFEENWKPHMEGWHLDKDILVKGNKIYSPETCCFLPVQINSLLVKRNSERGDYPIGVQKRGKRFRSCLNAIGQLGTFDTVEEAFLVHKLAKEQRIKVVADEWREKITEPTYIALINYKVEITD